MNWPVFFTFVAQLFLFGFAAVVLLFVFSAAATAIMESRDERRHRWTRCPHCGRQILASREDDDE